MQPESFYFLAAAEMPRLPSGKINTKARQETSAITAAKEDEHDDESLSDTSTAIGDDGSDLGIILRAMVAVFFKGSQITPTSDFFDDLGGHSLLAATLVSKLRKIAGNGRP